MREVGREGRRELVSHLAGRDRGWGCGGWWWCFGGGWGMSGWMGVVVSKSESGREEGRELVVFSWWVGGVGWEGWG